DDSTLIILYSERKPIHSKYPQLPQYFLKDSHFLHIGYKPSRRTASIELTQFHLVSRQPGAEDHPHGGLRLQPSFQMPKEQGDLELSSNFFQNWFLNLPKHDQHLLSSE